MFMYISGILFIVTLFLIYKICYYKNIIERNNAERSFYFDAIKALSVLRKDRRNGKETLSERI